MASDRRVAASLQVLIFVCLLAAVSGLQTPYYHPSMFKHSTPNFRPGEVIFVDLGNTNSCVAGYVPGNNETMFQHCIPSWVTFIDDGAVLVGEAAKNHADANPEVAVSGFKRLLGLRRNRVHHQVIVQEAITRVAYKIGTSNGQNPIIQVKAKDGAVKELDVVKITSMVMAELKRKAEESLGRKVRDAIITVPQHFYQGSTSAATYAGQLAGLDVEITVVEPTAAADAYGLRKKLREDGNALVLRVGGGTADATVLTLMDGNFEVFGYQNHDFLGGDDFDQRSVDYFVKLIRTKHGKDISEDSIALRKLRTACERAKKALSTQDHAQVSVESLFDGMDFTEQLSRSKFEELNEDLFGKVITLVERVMVEVKMEKNKNMIGEVVLVGGSTMIPKIQKLVKDYFHGKELNTRVKPDEAFALGAAIRIHSSD